MEELIVNLWAIYDADSGLVYGLSGKTYMASGEDHEKLTLLKALARTDHRTAKRFEVPSRFQVSYADGAVVSKVTLLNSVYDPAADLFENMFNNLEAELPPVMKVVGTEAVEESQSLPEDPLCVITVLYEDERGRTTPIVNESDREWVAHQEQLRGRRRAGY